jgi:hypothetical protein
VAGIFISYRRADSDGWAGRLRDTLRNRFGDLVFQDVDNIPDGEIFADVIARALKECDVALVIIGPNWAGALDEKGRRRLDQKDDWVRTETEMVLDRKIRVIPVLVGGARLPPAEELPESLRSLTHRQAREIRSTSWDSDVALLTNHLRHIVGSPHKRKLWLYATPAVIAILGVGLYAGNRYFGGSAPGPSAEIATAPMPTSAPPAPPIVKTPPVAKAPEVAPPAPEASPPPKAKIVEAAPEKPKALEPQAPVKAKAPEPQPPRQAKAPEAPKAPPAAVASAEPQVRKPPTPRPPVARPADPQTEQPRTARAEPTPTPPVTSRPPPEPRRPAPAAEAEPSADRVASAPPAPKPPAASGTRSTAINLPNRPPSARELKIGDSWTYKLKDVRFNKELATVTHEIGGGDSGGIRETVRIGGRRAAGESDADSSGVTRTSLQRRLPLEPRMFEQPVNREAVLLEFAPFMSVFSDLQPGLSWSKIAPGNSSDSTWRFSGKVAGRETVRVPAGTFEAIKAELEGNADIAFPTTRDLFNDMTPAYQTYSVWFVPEIGRAVKYERRSYNRGRRILEHEQYELLSYSLK